MGMGAAGQTGVAVWEWQGTKILAGTGGCLGQAVIEAIAEGAHLRAALGVPFPDPVLLARRNEFLLWPTMTPPACGGPCCGQIVYYSPGPRRSASVEIYYGVSYGLLRRRGGAHCDQDVSALSLALIAPQRTVQSLLQNRTFAQAERSLIRRHLHAPSALLRLRLHQVWLQAADTVRFPMNFSDTRPL